MHARPNLFLFSTKSLVSCSFLLLDLVRTSPRQHEACPRGPTHQPWPACVPSTFRCVGCPLAQSAFDSAARCPATWITFRMHLCASHARSTRRCLTTPPACARVAVLLRLRSRQGQLLRLSAASDCYSTAADPADILDRLVTNKNQHTARPPLDQQSRPSRPCNLAHDTTC